jgi:hypothetical protein
MDLKVVVAIPEALGGMLNKSDFSINKKSIFQTHF